MRTVWSASETIPELPSPPTSTTTSAAIAAAAALHSCRHGKGQQQPQGATDATTTVVHRHLLGPLHAGGGRSRRPISRT